MGNLRSMYRGIERWHLDTKGKAVRCKRIGTVSYPKINPMKQFKMTRYIQRVLMALGSQQKGD